MKFEGIKIEGLFGRFDYEIRIDEDPGIILLTAPNGYGKSTCLKLIDDFFEKRFVRIARQRFARIYYFFSDDTVVEVTKDPNTDESFDFPALTFKLTRKGHRPVIGHITSEFDIRDARMSLHRYVPHLERLDLCCGHDVVRVFGRALRRKWGNSRQFDSRPDGEEMLSAILRIGFETAHFESTTIFASLRNWERTNPDWRVLI